MDVMKIKTKFMRGIISKLMSKFISTKLGYKIDIKLNDIDIEMIDGDTHIHIDLDGQINSKEFTKLIKNSGLED